MRYWDSSALVSLHVKQARTFVCLDRKLGEAAQREGFAVVP